MAVVDVPSGYKYKVRLPWQVPYLMPLTLNHPMSMIMPPSSHHRLPDWTKLQTYGMPHASSSPFGRPQFFILVIAGQCEITKNTLRTFDGYQMELPQKLMQPSCSMIFARDSRRSHQINFIMTPVDQSGLKKVTLLISGHKIEIIPQVEKHWYSWRRSVDLEVKVNDERVTVSRYEPFVLEQSKEYSQ